MTKANSIVLSNIKPPVVRDENPACKMWQTSNFEIVPTNNVYVIGESQLKKPYLQAILINDSMCDTMAAQTRVAIHIFDSRQQPVLMANRAKRTTEAFRAAIQDDALVLASWNDGDLVLCRLNFEDPSRHRGKMQPTDCKAILSFDNHDWMYRQGGHTLFIGREDSLVIAGICQSVLETVSKPPRYFIGGNS